MLIQTELNMTDCETPHLRRSRSICVTKFVQRKHCRRTSLCTDLVNRNGANLVISPENFTPQACILKVLEEDKVLNALESPSISKEEEVNEVEKLVDVNDDIDYEQPLKVFRRAGTPDKTIRTAYEVPALKTHVSSCQALKQAVSTLYNIDDFEMTKIGEGFFSEVFKAYHKIDGKVLVLKRNKHRANRSAMLKEVQLMNNLHHPNILKYEGACVHEGQLHALTEYVNGGSLDQLIQSGSQDKGDFPWVDRVSLSFDINEGLLYLHSRGIFHRDLTSKNILIRRSGDKVLSAVVADFGLAAQIPQNPEEEKLPQVGSPYWMSPECLQGHFYDHRSDTFSFGIILCEMIARVEADPDYLPRTKNFGVDYLAFSDLVNADCPPDFLKVAYSCVTIDPESRPSCDELKVSFRQILNAIKPKKIEVKHLTEKMNGMKLPPASCHLKKHSTTTPVAIGKEMSKLDPHYIPAPAEGMNPFLSLFGEGTLLANCFSCFEFNAIQTQRPSYRKTVSMIGEHPSSLVESSSFN